MTCRLPPTDRTRLRFRLSITADTFEAYYRGRVRQVQVRSSDGTLVRFPASALRPFLTHAGIDGEFELTFDQNRRLIALRRLHEGTGMPP
jgi:hypothetical protein